jgi:hypothetical protein
MGVRTVPGGIEIRDQGGEIEPVPRDRPPHRNAVIDLIDPLHQNFVELGGDRGRGWRAAILGAIGMQQRRHGGGAINLPDQAGGGIGRAIGAGGRADLVVVEPCRGGIEHAADIEDDRRGFDQRRLTGAEQDMVLPRPRQAKRQAQHGIGDHFITMKLATMGDEQRLRRQGHAGTR